MARALVVSRDRALQQTLRAVLEMEGCSCLSLSDGDEFMRVCAEYEPDVVLMSVQLPGTSGLELCGELRASESARHPAVLLVADQPDPYLVAGGLLAGADDFLTDVMRTEEVRARIHVQLRNQRMISALLRLRSERDSLRRDAQSDALTGLANRRALERSVSERCQATQRFGVLFMDIDFFKGVNDQFGHDVGDAVLVAVAEVLKQGLRPGDLVARYGGEEFVALIAGAGQESARLVAERLRQSVEELPAFDNGPHRVTISVGAAVFDPHRRREGSLDVLRRADTALYQAKRSGRNCVVVLGADDANATAPDLNESTTTHRSRTSHDFVAAVQAGRD